MSYWLFDLLAVAAPAALLLARARGRRRVLVPTAVLAAVAVGWTLPWDRHLVRTLVWTYDPTAVRGLVASVPVEELGFIVLQVALIGAWMLHVGGLRPLPYPTGPSTVTPAGARTWAVVAVIGLALVGLGGHLRYLGLLLAWVAPPFALQHAVAHDLLVHDRARRLLRALPVALWLCVCDRVALSLGIWTIGPDSATGLAVAGLPVEEALFFWLTCLLTADGLMLLSQPVVLARVAGLVRRHRVAPQVAPT